MNRRLLGFLVVLCLAGASQAATYYVNGSTAQTSGGISFARGADSYSGLSPSRPWATIGRAYSAVQAGDIVQIAAGRYAVKVGSTGTWHLNRTFQKAVTFSGVTGKASDVVVLSSNASEVLLSTTGDSASNTVFKDLSFNDGSVLRQAVLRVSDPTEFHGISFSGCVFTGNSDEANRRPIVTVASSRGGTGVYGLSFDYCVTRDNAGECEAFRVAGVHVGDPLISDIKITHHQNTCSYWATRFYGQRITITDLESNAGHGYGLLLGRDGDPTSDSGAQCVSVTLAGIRVTSAQGHGVLIGTGCSDVTANGVWVRGGDQGLVLKECERVQVANVAVELSTDAARSGVYLKAAKHCTVTDFDVYGIQSLSTGGLLRVGSNVTGTAFEGVVVTDGWISGVSSLSRLLSFAAERGTAEEIGTSSRTDGIAYDPLGSQFGVVFGQGVTGLADLRKAWKAFGHPQCDTTSIVGSGNVFVTTVPSGLRPTYILFWDSQGRLWNGTGWAAVRAGASRGIYAHWNAYPVIAGQFRRHVPRAWTAGTYSAVVYQMVGSFPASGDRLVTQKPIVISK